ncbi:T9SS type A sorting domain-containing protein [Hymenobacter rubidus]|uniref:T9SS type A sorting domain-containing protein n=1 Tax=Hymenobacter rubidus TaxID=1441626 RepID=UPI00191E172D|nr:T9SS type A sorting domain-containing protein [Hymenobacter rubidus]
MALGFCLAVPHSAQGQAPELHCLMQPLEPAVRARQATLVVEAEVLDTQGFWDARHGRLFTRHRLRVFSLLKGQVADTTALALITEGGRLGLDQQILTNTLRLVPGQQGVFFLTRAPWPGLPATAGRAYTPFGSEQGFIEYNLAERTAAEPFRTYPAIDAGFYQGIAQLTGQPQQQLLPNPALAAPASRTARRGTLAPTIAGFAPTSLPAGTDAVLTITGDGFGSSRGSGFVEFKNADDGGATRVKARDADYLTWTTTRIQVRVPTTASGGSPVSNGHPAGSGLLRITTSDQLVVESATPVTVVYALTTVESTDGKYLQRPNHVALNTTGGITFRFGPNFSASPAAAWQRALATWRCNTGMNWDTGTTNAANTIADDGQSVVAFDNGSELPAQVLGRTTSYYSGCFAPSGEVVFWVKEIDMQFDDATVWQFGPALALASLGQIDFESVAVHELGHAQQLSHLILPGAVMHYAVARGQNTRALNAISDVAGGRQVLRGRSFKNLGCGGPALLPAPLTGFNAQYTAAGGVTLAWTTRDECFLNGFVVERSLSGDTTAWMQVGTAVPRPPASQYQFVDLQPPGGLHYYRLRLQRPGGSLDNVAPAVLSTNATDVSIFPNPVAGDLLRLQYPLATETTVIFRIYNGMGQRVRAQAVIVPIGLNVLSLNIAGLGPGFYVLQWQDAQGQFQSRKFIRL